MNPGAWNVIREFVNLYATYARYNKVHILVTVYQTNIVSCCSELVENPQYREILKEANFINLKY